MSRGGDADGSNGATETDGQRRVRRSKVGRLIDDHDLDGLGQELEDRWTGATDDQLSLRDLADLFNRRVLRATLDDAGRRLLDGEVENLYRLLTADDVSEGMRVDARMSLDRDGVDVETLEREFVSHQAIHTYLTKYRGASLDDESDEAEQDDARLAKDAETIRRLAGRTATVTEGTLERLASTGRIDLGDADVLVDVRVICRDCGTAMEVDQLLETGGCACGR